MFTLQPWKYMPERKHSWCWTVSQVTLSSDLNEATVGMSSLHPWTHHNDPQQNSKVGLLIAQQGFARTHCITEDYPNVTRNDELTGKPPPSLLFKRYCWTVLLCVLRTKTLRQLRMFSRTELRRMRDMTPLKYTENIFFCSLQDFQIKD